MAEDSQDKITILVVDGDRRVARWLDEHLSAEPDMVVVGTSSTAQDALRQVGELHPDVVLLESSLSDGDGIDTAWLLAARSPRSVVILMAQEASLEYAQRAMRAGAQGYLPKPLNADDVINTVRQTAQQFRQRQALIAGLGRAHRQALEGMPTTIEGGKRVAIFGAKGGVGKTTISVNLAIALKQRTGRSVLLMDADYFFGDACVQLDLQPHATIVDLAQRVELRDMDSDILRLAVASHSSGIHVLAGPERPEQGGLIYPELVQKVLTVLPSIFDFVIVDCQPYYDERTLRILEYAEKVLFVLTPEMGPLRNTRFFRQLTKSLDYPQDRIVLILNKANSNPDITPEDAEKALGAEILFRIGTAGKELVAASNLGQPFVLRHPNSAISKSIFTIAHHILSQT